MSAAYFVVSGIHQLISQLVAQYLKSVSEENRLSLPQLISRSIDLTQVVRPLDLLPPSAASPSPSVSLQPRALVIIFTFIKFHFLSLLSPVIPNHY